MMIAGVYAILVAAAVWVSYPTERQIASDTARNALWAVQQHEEKYRTLSLKDIRRRQYRGLTDEQIIERVREFAASEEQRIRGNLAPGPRIPGVLPGALPGGDTVRPKVAVLMEEIERTRERRLASLESDQRSVVVWGVAAWALPLVLLYFLGPRLIRRRRRAARRI
jgi:hypothetical protein